MKGRNFLVGFLIGGIAASISTLLAAPASGSDTRVSMKEHTDFYLKQLAEVTDSLKEIKHAVASASAEGKKAIKSFITDIKIAVSNWQDEIQPHQQELQKELESIELSIQELESQLNKK